MEVYDDDILFRRIKTTVPDHYHDGKFGLQAFGLRKLSHRRIDPSTGHPVEGKAGKYEEGYSVNVARLSSVAKTIGTAGDEFIVVGFRVAELRNSGFVVRADEVKEGHLAYTGPGSENASHALVISAGECFLYEQEGKEALANCCRAVDQASEEVLGAVVLDL